MRRRYEVELGYADDWYVRPDPYLYTTNPDTEPKLYLPDGTVLYAARKPFGFNRS